MKDPYQLLQNGPGSTNGPGVLPAPGQLIVLGQRGAEGLVQLGQQLGGAAANVLTPQNVQTVLRLAQGVNSGFFGLTGAAFGLASATAPVVAPLLNAIPTVGPALSAVYGAVGTVGTVAGPIATAAGAAGAGLAGPPVPPPDGGAAPWNAAPQPAPQPPTQPLVDAAGNPLLPVIS